MTTGVDAQTCKLIVLDSNIGSMTEFKQIIGRGTRINEEYGKTYFTIMDFRNVTNHFADPAFDDDPVMIKELGEHDPLEGIDDAGEDERPPLDPDSGEEVEFEDPEEEESGGTTGPGPRLEPRTKVYVDGVLVEVINQRIQYLDGNGKIITESLTDYTRKNVLKKYQSLDNFLLQWNNADKKKVIIEELEAEGVFFDSLKEEVGSDWDPFDLICHVAFDAKPLTRKERAENVKKRDYFSKYSKKAQAVLQNLLEKYADSGLVNVESTEILRMDPFNKIGTPLELVRAFGSKEDYERAIRELETELYKTGA
jgi:type I restriction enzyme R subunit